MNVTVSKQQAYAFAVDQDAITLIEIKDESRITHFSAISFDEKELPIWRDALTSISSNHVNIPALREKMLTVASALKLNNFRENETGIVRPAIRQWKKYSQTSAWYRSGDYSFHDGSPRVGNDLRSYDLFYDEENILSASRILFKPNRSESYIGYLEKDDGNTLAIRFFDKSERPVEVALIEDMPFKLHAYHIDAQDGLLNAGKSLQCEYKLDSLEKINSVFNRRITEEKANQACRSNKVSTEELFLQEILHMKAPYHAPREIPSMPKDVKTYIIE